MNNVLPSYSNKVRYRFIGDFGTEEISEPIGWNEDEKTFKRSTKVHGTFTNLSNSLRFYIGDVDNNGGYNYLKQTYDIYGINAQVLLIKDDDIDNVWVESYRGYLDFSTYSIKNNIAEIKFNESGLYEKIKARQSEKLELGRLTTMDGDTIPELSTETVALDGRQIQIVSKLTDKTPQFGNIIIASGEDYEARAFPLGMVSEETGNIQTIYEYEVPETAGGYASGTIGNMFYSVADVDLELDLEFDINTILDILETVYSVKLDLVKYGNGVNYDFISRQTLIEKTNLSGFGNQLSYSGVLNNYQLNQGESLCLALYFNFKGIIIIYPEKSELLINERKFFDKSTAKFVLPYEALDRMLHIITGRGDALKSTILGRTDTPIIYETDGDGTDACFTGLTNGFWVREFNDEQLTTSFKDLEESFNTVWQTGYGIEKLGFKEQVRFERISHFYKNLVTIRITEQPKNIKRTVAKDYFYSSLEFGYNKPSGDRLYEEAMGLDEYNIKNTYTTPITRVENVFKKESKYRSDSYGREFARQKPISAFPKEDTRYDKEVMVMDLKRNALGVGNYEERKWADDFVVPSPFSTLNTGVYSPDTATNLRFSPMNLLLRWGFWIKCGLEKYKDKEIRYSSSEGNSSLKTQLIGGEEHSENGTLLAGDLDSSLFIPEYIEFEYPLDTTLLKSVSAKTLYLGDEIMNYYGLVEFVNEEGLYEYGFLMELKPNKQGQWKLLKANKKIARKSVYENALPLETGIDCVLEGTAIALSLNSMTLSTISTSGIFSPATVINTGTTLDWTVSGGVTIATTTIDDPTFNFSTNSGTANVLIENIDNLEVLNINALSITLIDLSNAINLLNFNINSNLLTTLDVSLNINLTDLDVEENNLTAIDTSINVLLTTLKVSGNSITTFDISNNILLSLLYCFGNSFSVILTNQLLADLVANGVTNGDLWYRNNETGQGVTDRATLVTRGWTIINNAT